MTAHPNLEPILRIERLTAEEFRNGVGKAGQPVVITGALDWPALGRWSHEWFRDKFGATEVELSVNPTHTHRVLKMRLDEYVNRIVSNSRMNGGLYLDQFPLDRLPALWKYFSIPKYCPSDRRVLPHLWLGPGTTVISFHKDNHHPLGLIDNIFVQVCGRKQIIVAGPENDAFMYPRTLETGAHWHSRVDPLAPDFDSFPLFRHARLQEATIGPGEICFIPRDYWHYVRALERSISLSFWWYPFRLMEVAVRVAQLNEAAVETLSASSEISISSDDIRELGGPGSLTTSFASFSDRALLSRLARNLGVLADDEARRCISACLAAATAHARG